jgi:glycosyltransferase involved in cell wall biosynthesis
VSAAAFSSEHVANESFAEFPNIGACYAQLYPSAKKVFVSPDIAASSVLNPYLRRLYADLPTPPISLKASHVWKPVAAQHADQTLWHQHWLQCSSLPTCAKSFARLSAAGLYRARGGRILWTVHNLKPHVDRYAAANRTLTASMRKLADHFHVHSHAAGQELCRAWDVAPEQVVVVPHPAYDTAPIARADARAALRAEYGIDLTAERTFLVFGLIARYKQIVEAIAAFDGLDPKRVQLVVAGALRANETDYGDAIRRALGRGPVSLCDRFIPEAHVAWFFGAVDTILFNYRQILTSGAVQLARDFHKPIWIPDLPALAGLTGPDVSRFRDAADLRAQLEQVSYAPRIDGVG